MDEMQIFPPLLSINTWRPGVAEATLRVGGHLLNDLSALPTDQNARIAANYGTGLLIMHSIGLPKQRHTDIRYADVLRTLESFFDQKMNKPIDVGAVRDALVIVPHINDLNPRFCFRFRERPSSVTSSEFWTRRIETR
jgi:dihydropteroate synthase